MSAGGPPGRGGIVVWHDEQSFTLTAQRPIELQIDGEGMGTTTEVSRSRTIPRPFASSADRQAARHASAFSRVRIANGQKGYLGRS